MRNFFGTDGIRGEYGKIVTESVAYKLGAALGESGGVTVVCRDTRLSGGSLSNALIKGVFDAGGNAVNIGILPTNAAAYFTRRLDADFGVMISASHNPPRDNGLKVFNKYGYKICEKKQIEISQRMTEQSDISAGAPVFPIWADAEEIYLAELSTIARLNGLEIALDCGYGSAYKIAPAVFKRAGAVISIFNDTLDGAKINVRCGATCPRFLTEKTKSIGLGFSYDGDADRLAVVENGKIIDANVVFYALAKFYDERGMLSRGTVAGTVLTNVGVERALNNIGLKLARSDVGDANLAELMNEKGINLGGEESGHYLLYDYATSSDAVINSLAVANMVSKAGSISDYAKELKLVDVSKFDAVVSAEQKEKLLKNNFIKKTTVKLNGEFPEARIVIRFSGTEPKLRFFAEADENGEKIIEKAKKLFYGCC